MVGREDVYVIPHIRIPVIYASYGLWGGLDCSCSGRRDFHDIVHSELDRSILEQVQDLVGVLNGGGNTILFPPFCGLSGEVPPVHPILNL